MSGLNSIINNQTSQTCYRFSVPVDSSFNMDKKVTYACAKNTFDCLLSDPSALAYHHIDSSLLDLSETNNVYQTEFEGETVAITTNIFYIPPSDTQITDVIGKLGISQANVSVTSGFDDSSIPLYNTVFSSTITDGLDNGTVNSTNYLAMFDVSNANYNMMKSINSAETTGTNMITIREDFYFNTSDSIFSSKRFAMDSTTHQVVASSYKDPSNANVNTSMYDYDFNGYTGSIDTDPSLVPAFGMWKMNQPAPTIDVSYSVAVASLPFAFIDASANISDISTTLSLTTFNTLFNDNIADISNEFKLTVKNTDPGAGFYTEVASSMIGDIATSSTLNPTYMQLASQNTSSGFSDPNGHSFSVTNGSVELDYTLDNSLNYVNDSFATTDVYDGEYLSQANITTDGSLKLYYSNRVIDGGSYSYNRAFFDASNDLMPNVQVTYDYASEGGNVNVGEITSDVKHNEFVSFATTVLIPSTADTANTFSTVDETKTYHVKNIAQVNDTAFIIEAAINTSNSPRDITCTSNYVPPTGSFAIFDIATNTNYSEDSNIYDSETNESVSQSQASIQGAELITSADAQQFRANILPRTLDSSFSSMSAGGWTLNSSGEIFQVQKGTVDIFGSDAYGIATLPQSLPLVLNMNLICSPAAKNVDYLTTELVYSYDVSYGDFTSTGSFTATEFTYNIDSSLYVVENVNVSDPSFLYTYTGASFPNYLQLKKIVKTVVKTATADFPFGTITNLTVTTPSYTETDTYYELWNGDKKLADFFLNKIKLNNTALLAHRTQTVTSSGMLNYDWSYLPSDLWTHTGEIQAYNGTTWYSFSDTKYVDLSYDNATTLTTIDGGSDANIVMVFDIPFDSPIVNSNLIVSMNVAPTGSSSTSGNIVGYKYDTSSDLSQFVGWDMYMDDIVDSGVDLEPAVIYTVIPAEENGGAAQLLVEVKIDGNVVFTMSGQANISQNIRILCIPGTVMQVIKNVSTGESESTETVSYVMPVTTVAPETLYWAKINPGIELQCYSDTYPTTTSTFQLNTDHISLSSYGNDTSHYTTVNPLNSQFASYTEDLKVKVQSTGSRGILFDGFRGIVPNTSTANAAYQFVKLHRSTSSVIFTAYLNGEAYSQTYSNVYMNKSLAVNALTQAISPFTNIGNIGLTFNIKQSMLGADDDVYVVISIEFAQYLITVVNPISQSIQSSVVKLASANSLYSTSAFSIIPRTIIANGESYIVTYNVPSVILSRSGTTGIGEAPLTSFSGSVGSYSDATMRMGVHIGGGSVIMMRSVARVKAHTTYFQSVRPQFLFTQLNGKSLTSSTYPSNPSNVGSSIVSRYGSLGALVNNVDNMLALIYPFAGDTTTLNNIAFAPLTSSRKYTSYRDSDQASIDIEQFAIPSNRINIKMYNGYIDSNPNNSIPDGSIVSNMTNLIPVEGDFIATIYSGHISGLVDFTGHSYTSNDTMVLGVNSFIDQNSSGPGPLLHPMSAEINGNGFTLNISRPFYMYDQSNIDYIYTPKALKIVIGDKFIKSSFAVQFGINVSSTISVYGTIPRYDVESSRLYMDVHRYTTGYGISFENLTVLDLRTLLFNAFEHSVCSIPVPNATFGETKINYDHQISLIDETAPLTWVLDENYESRFIDFSVNALTTTGITKLISLFNITEAKPKNVLLCKLKDILRINGNDGIPLMRIMNNGKIRSTVGLSSTSVTLSTIYPEHQYQESGFYPNVVNELSSPVLDDVILV